MSKVWFVTGRSRGLGCGIGAGKEPGDPRKTPQKIVDRAHSERAPSELLLGADALHHARIAAKTVVTSDETWKHLTAFVSFQLAYRIGGIW